MKIALLNMRYDNNYGGNLQRYALVRVLQKMGHEVTYLYIRDNWDDWFAGRSWRNVIDKQLKQVVRHLLHPTSEPWLVWHREKEEYKRLSKATELFLNRYIPHTKPIMTHAELCRAFQKGNYDAIIAGSDQIWRKKFVERYGLGTWFFDFVPSSWQGKRVIYGASFGVAEQEYNKEDTKQIRALFEQMDVVSVREDSGLNLLREYGWSKPEAIQVVDPTLLLERADYEELINAVETHPLDGTMFCYILDRSEDKMATIERIARERDLIPVVRTIADEPQDSIEQWLRNIRDAKYVITDSYHGLLFSIIFEKEYHLIQNSFRGSARFESIIKILPLLREKKQTSIEFLRNSLL